MGGKKYLSECARLVIQIIALIYKRTSEYLNIRVSEDCVIADSEDIQAMLLLFWDQ